MSANEQPARRPEAPAFSLEALREKLSRAKGKTYWRSLEDLAASEEAMGALRRAFPRQMAVAEWDPVDRRDFLRLMGASLALAGLTACTKQPPEKIVPYVQPPEELVPGKPLYYATAMELGGYGLGLLVESQMGRPIKVEGNPEHPASLGSTDVFAQASVLGLYDPDRSEVHTKLGRVATWDNFAEDVGNAMGQMMLGKGAGLRILTRTVTSPSLAQQIKDLQQAYPEMAWVQYEPVNGDNAHDGAQLAFGEAVSAVHRFDRASVVVSLDADFLSSGPGRVRYARDFMAKRNPELPGGMNRLYVVETGPTVTGATADHRLAVRPGDVERIARSMARALGIEAALGEGAGHAEWVDAVVRDLKQQRGACLVVAGERQPPAVHALAHAMNEALGAFGRTVILTEPVEAAPVHQGRDLAKLVKDMNDGRVQMLVILDANPVYEAPGDLRFVQAMENVATCVHLGLYEDETAAACHWHIAGAHFLEAWGDVRAFDGTATIVQPLIEPLYSGKSAIEVIAALRGMPSKGGYDLVRQVWQTRLGEQGFDDAWHRIVHDGVVPGTAAGAKALKVKTGFAGEAPKPVRVGPGELEIAVAPDYSVWDGRFANNGWLQEAPRPVTKLTWDNALLMAQQTATYRRLNSGFLVEADVQGRRIRVPVLVVPGHPEDCATLHLGYGRTQAGRTGTGVGGSACALRLSAQPWSFVAAVNDTGIDHVLATTQDHHHIEADVAAADRHLYRSATLAEFRADPGFVRHDDEFGHQPESMYPGFDYSKGNQWGMVIDLNACTGCNACLIACQAENNISVVGKDQVRRGREMHWIRIDRYFGGDPAAPKILHQPVTCMHCENAPCEAVCPVAATTHSNEGLNQMVYNRCVGTRYCSNNCPYKVRRFNFYKFADHTTPSLKLLRNPDVTVRARGIMEKCTYCTQRISAARIEAKRKGRIVAEGEVLTACQQVCPTKAIVFGDINDPASEVARRRKSPLHYGMLVELNTRPRTTYLARVTNPNPELEPAGHPAAPAHHGEA
jgi:MoCo/4Fe-4S cofactor protein with predicted Tat translocation signal